MKDMVQNVKEKKSVRIICTFDNEMINNLELIKKSGEFKNITEVVKDALKLRASTDTGDKKSPPLSKEELEIFDEMARSGNI